MSTGSVAAPAPAPGAAPRRRRLTERARAERRLAAWLVGPAAIVMLAVTAYPVIDTIILSLQRSDLRFPGQNKFIGLSTTVTCSPLRCGGRTSRTRWSSR